MAARPLSTPRFAFSGTPVFLYHDVCDAITRDRFAVSVASFKQQLAALREHAISTADIARIGDIGTKRQIVLTFDDGLASHYEQAFPELLNHGFRATFCVSSALVGSAGYLTWKHIREMSDAGMTIGSHGWHHTDYSLLDASVALHQLRASRESLEDAIGRPVTSFSAPYGFLSLKLMRIVREAGFDHICSSFPALAGAASEVIPRIAVNSHTSLPEFLALALGTPTPILSRLARHAFLYVPKQLLLRTWPQRLGVKVQEVAR